MRVGEKETSEQAEIVARYADLFTREQHESLRDEEDAAEPATSASDCTASVRRASAASSSPRSPSARTASRTSFLAARVDFRGESLPLRSAQAMLAILDEYADAQRARRPGRGRLGPFQRRPPGADCGRRRLSTRELSGDPDPIGQERASARQSTSTRSPSALGTRCAGAGRVVRAAPRALGRPHSRRGAGGGAGLLPRLLPATALAARGHLHEGASRSRLPRERSRASASTSRRRSTSASTSTTGRRRTRERA